MHILASPFLILRLTLLLIAHSILRRIRQYSLFNDVAVKKTLESFNASAVAFTSRAEELTEKIGQQQAAHSADVKASFDGLAVQLKADYAALNAAVTKRVAIMGGISVVCSIVALVLSFIK